MLLSAFLITVASGATHQLDSGIFTVESSLWAQEARCQSGDPITLHVNMVVAEKLQLESVFWAVSDPDNERYGKHLSMEELTKLVGSDAADLDIVASWLKGAGATEISISQTKDMIRTVMPCNNAEVAFATTIHQFRHRSLNTTLLRATAAHSIPSTLAAHVAFVGDLNGLPAPQHPILAEADPLSDPFPTEDNCNHKCSGQYVTPGVLTKAYNLGDSPKTAKGSMGVAEFQGVMWDQPALDKFSTACGLTPALNISNQIGTDSPKKCEIPIIGTQNCAEAMLDIEYIGAIGGAIPLTDVYSAQYSLFDLTTTLMNLPKAQIPLVMSVSYGNDESQQKSVAYMQQCNQQFMKIGAIGVSVLFAAGDQGVLGRSGPGKVYHPDFPAASPYVTAVGGTDFVTKGAIGPEKVWSAGGGGFSNTFPIPQYQATAVAGYMKSAGTALLPPAAKWNSTGRAYPDVSALGGQDNPYCIIVGGLFVGVAGTSAACPVVAATFAKLNEVRLASGGQPLGFLNPWIYKVGSAGFNDVAQGRNCGSPVCKNNAGFPAIAGWDAATGFGTPDYEKLKTFL